MTKKAKLYARIRNSQKNVRFADFQALLEYFGFALVRSPVARLSYTSTRL